MNRTEYCKLTEIHLWYLTRPQIGQIEREKVEKIFELETALRRARRTPVLEKYLRKRIQDIYTRFLEQEIMRLMVSQPYGTEFDFKDRRQFHVSMTYCVHGLAKNMMYFTKTKKVIDFLTNEQHMQLPIFVYSKHKS